MPAAALRSLVALAALCWATASGSAAAEERSTAGASLPSLAPAAKGDDAKGKGKGKGNKKKRKKRKKKRKGEPDKGEQDGPRRRPPAQRPSPPRPDEERGPGRRNPGAEPDPPPEQGPGRRAPPPTRKERPSPQKARGDGGGSGPSKPSPHPHPLARHSVMVGLQTGIGLGVINEVSGNERRVTPDAWGALGAEVPARVSLYAPRLFGKKAHIYPGLSFGRSFTRLWGTERRFNDGTRDQAEYGLTTNMVEGSLTAYVGEVKGPRIWSFRLRGGYAWGEVTSQRRSAPDTTASSAFTGFVIVPQIGLGRKLGKLGVFTTSLPFPPMFGEINAANPRALPFSLDGAVGRITFPLDFELAIGF